MTTFPYAPTSLYSRRVIAAIAVLALAACGGGDANDPAAPNFSVTSAESDVAVKSGAALFGASKITVTNNGIGASDISASFKTAQDAAQPLVPDLANPGQFWLPVTVAATAGTLSIAAPGRVAIAIPFTLTPFKANDVPGTATRDFLQASLSNTNAAIKDLLMSRPLPDLLKALNSTVDLTQQELTWVSKTMQVGTAVIATRKDGAAVKMTTDDLKALDQMVLHAEALRLRQGTSPTVAQLSTWMKIIDVLVPSAHAQTSDSAAFISGARATGDGLGLTANMVPGIAPAGASAFHRDADAQAVTLNMAGLYAAHYGNALATLQTLPNLTFAQPVDKVQIAVSDLFAGVINEIVLPDLNKLTQDNAVALVGSFMDSVDNKAVENIVMDAVIIFKTRSVGIRLCPTGTTAVADADVDFVSCLSLQ
jgi:hypothetical protein